MTQENTKSRIVILGAGATGLSAGVRLISKGHEVCILEKADHPGGLAKTIKRGDYLLDIGPHHLFSQNEAILKEIIDLFKKKPKDVIIETRDAVRTLKESKTKKDRTSAAKKIQDIIDD